AVLPDDGTCVPVYIERPAHYLAFAVNAVTTAPNIPRKRAEVRHNTILPEESVNGCVARGVREPGHLALVIDVIRKVYSASEAAEVGHRAVLPEHGVKSRCATTRGSGNLATVVDRKSCSRRVADERRKFLDPAFFPNDRFKLKNLGNLASRIRGAVLCLPDHLPPAVNPSGKTVTASQRGERGRYAFLP